MKTIQALLLAGREQLATSSNSARLDAEVLLAHVLDVKRSYLYTWPEHMVSDTQQQRYQALLRLRQQHKPIAYLIGYAEFWSLSLQVNAAVLIPRAATELLVTTALTIATKQTVQHVAELGCGSGAIAIALAKEQPQWHIVATEKHLHALELAAHNCQQHACHNINLVAMDWCRALPRDYFDLIISNPPYIALNDVNVCVETQRYEPPIALYAHEDGLQAIRVIIQTASEHLRQRGWLLLEHGFTQAAAVQALLHEAGYSNIQTVTDLAAQPRVTYGQRC